MRDGWRSRCEIASSVGSSGRMPPRRWTRVRAGVAAQSFSALESERSLDREAQHHERKREDAVLAAWMASLAAESMQ